MAAPKFGLGNLTAILDSNRIQLLRHGGRRHAHRAGGRQVAGVQLGGAGGRRPRRVRAAARLRVGGRTIPAGRRSSSPTPPRARASRSWRTPRRGTRRSVTDEVRARALAELDAALERAGAAATGNRVSAAGVGAAASGLADGDRRTPPAWGWELGSAGGRPRCLRPRAGGAGPGRRAGGRPWTPTSRAPPRSSMFAEAFPERFFQIGIAEQNMTSIAAGLAAMGLIPFTSTFACFASKRATDQIRIGIAQPRMNVKITGAYSGLLAGKTGKTHQSVQDIAIIRSMPEMVVLAPGDGVETAKAVWAAAAYDGPVYLRLTRDPSPVLFDDGYDVPHRQGGRAAGRHGRHRHHHGPRWRRGRWRRPTALAAEGLSVHVLHVPTVKPLDVDARRGGRRPHRPGGDGRRAQHHRRPGRRRGRGAGRAPAHPDAARGHRATASGSRRPTMTAREVRTDRRRHRPGLPGTRCDEGPRETTARPEPEARDARRTHETKEDDPCSTCFPPTSPTSGSRTPPSGG